MVELARQMRESGETIRAIAAHCGVSTWTVQQWTKGITPKLPERLCEYPPCSKPFHPTRADQKFCCPGHKGEHRHYERKMRSLDTVGTKG